MVKKSAIVRLLIFALCSYLVVGDPASNWTCKDPCSDMMITLVRYGKKLRLKQVLVRKLP